MEKKDNAWNAILLSWPISFLFIFITWWEFIKTNPWITWMLYIALIILIYYILEFISNFNA